MLHVAVAEQRISVALDTTTREHYNAADEETLTDFYVLYDGGYVRIYICPTTTDDLHLHVQRRGRWTMQRNATMATRRQRWQLRQQQQQRRRQH